MSHAVAEATDHLTRLSGGDPSAVSDLMPLVYDELRRVAAMHLARERPNHTLQPTALAHEAYLKLVDQTRAQWKDRAHFLAVAAEAIRRILIDHARLHRAAKRGSGDARLTLSFAADVPEPQTDVDLIALEDALQRLAELSPRQARVVELRFFAGLDVEETAEAIGVSPRTVKGDWRVARAWLQRELGEGEGDGEGVKASTTDDIEGEEAT
jgi:RNA polymerase sigma-70 factor, ECF subfamily